MMCKDNRNKDNVLQTTLRSELFVVIIEKDVCFDITGVNKPAKSCKASRLIRDGPR